MMSVVPPPASGTLTVDPEKASTDCPAGAAKVNGTFEVAPAMVP